jgi:hypothetical protein
MNHTVHTVDTPSPPKEQIHLNFDGEEDEGGVYGGCMLFRAPFGDFEFAGVNRMTHETGQLKK